MVFARPQIGSSEQPTPARSSSAFLTECSGGQPTDFKESLPSPLLGEWERAKQRFRNSVEAHIKEQEAFLEKVLQRHEAAAPEVAGKWVRAVYYYNVETMESQFEAPEEFRSARFALHAARNEENPEARDARPLMGGAILKARPCESSWSGSTGRRPSLNSAAGDFRIEIMRDLEASTDSGPVRWIAKTAARFHERWLKVQEPERRGVLADFVKGVFFEFVSFVCIILFAVWMLIAADETVETLQEERTGFMAISERFFFCFFCCEVLLRLLVHRLYYFFNDDWAWNLFDFVLVGTAVYEKLVEYLVPRDGNLTIDLIFLRSMRLMKMVKALRVLKMLRFISELRFMINSVLGSFTSLIWCAVMLTLMFFFFSLAFVQGVGTYLIEVGDAISAEDRELLLMTYGSVLKSMGTCFKAVTGGSDWGNYYDIIAPTGVANCVVFLFFVTFSMIALLNIVTGVFVENAMQLGQPELGHLAFEQRKKDIEDAGALRKVFSTIDLDGSGTITASEFHRCIQNERIKSQFAVLGLSIKDAELFFEMLTNVSPDNEVDLDFFVEACLKMKGAASSLDLQSLSYEAKIIHQSLESFRFEAQSLLNDIRDGVMQRRAADARPLQVLEME